MADANEILKEVESLEGDEKVKFLTNKVTELFDNSKELESKIEFERSEAKKAFDARDEVKQKYRELENKLTSGSTETQELMKAKDEKIDSLSSQLDELTKAKEELSKTVEAVETARRNEILESVPEEHREPLKDIKDLNVLSKNAKQLNELLNASKGSSFKTKGGKLGFNISDDTTWDSLTMSQRAELKEKNPERYEQIRKKKFGR